MNDLLYRVSIIIVTYNSEGFISFCLDSIFKSTSPSSIEVIIVDNNSDDHTLQVIGKYESQITVIQNDRNIGFSASCNQGARIAQSDYLLFLNPDCILSEETIDLLLNTVQKDNIGMVSPLLLDGSGKQLPESSREVPSIPGAVSQLLGIRISSSKKYYRDIVNKTAFESPVLSGACLMISKKDFYEIGMFDEHFFMYGEDVDISIRMLGSGKVNICNSETQAIHFKGESTDKSKLKYSYNFYNSMQIYVDKHINKDSRFKWKVLIYLSTYLGVIFKFTKHTLIRIRKPLIDFIFILIVLFLSQYVWSYFKSGSILYYGHLKYLLNYLAYAILWVISFYLQGLYNDRSKMGPAILKGTVYGGIIILILYALLPENLRFSRMIILCATFFVFVIIYFKYSFNQLNNRIKNFLYTTNEDRIILYKDRSISDIFVSKAQLLQIHKKGRLNNLVFDTNVLSFSEIINIVSERTGEYTFEFFDAKNGIQFSSKDADGQGVALNELSHFHLTQRHFQIQKRIFDLCAIAILSLPVLIYSIVNRKIRFHGWRNILYNKKTIVGYNLGSKFAVSLPRVKDSLLTCYPKHEVESSQFQIAKEYSSNYSVLDDVYISFEQIGKLISKLN